MEKADFPETLAEKRQGNSPVAASRLHNTPRADGFYMPAEWALHKQTWLIWPERPDVWRLGGKPVQAVFTKMAKAIADFEPVTVCVSTQQYENARARLNHANIRVVEMSYDGEWVRDTGPTFVINNKGEVRGVHWDFNAWGGLNGGHCFPWARDQQVAQKILEIEHCMRYRAEYCVEHHTKQFILEGGSIHVDGEGTLITTTECLLNPNRNPDCGRHEIEEVLCEYLSVEKIIWLEKGIYNDETSGHVDNLCCFVRPGELVLSWTDDPIDPNFEVCHAALDVLKRSTDAKGRPLIIHKLPIPILCATEEECSGIDESTSTHCQPNVRLPGSYVNFLIVNGGIVAPSFGDTIKDLEALTVMKQIWPERKIVQIYSREIILGLGNIHCITQQQPAGQQEK